MAINEMGFNQLSTVLAAITSQATGATVVAPVDTASFVSVAQTALKTGYDPMMAAVSQVLSRTIFSVRPYSRRFSGLEVTRERYGNHIRKLQALDLPFEEDNRLKLTDGQSIDQYIVKKPGVLQTNFYGENVFQKSITIFRDQMDTAFEGPEQFGRFISMILSNASDQIEQAKESVERATVANLIAGVTVVNEDATLHLVTLYNAFAGTTLTSATVAQPENWRPFVQWLVGFLGNLMDKMAERSQLYHLNITGKTVMRHTPAADRHMYLASDFVNHMEAGAMSDTFHDNYLNVGTFNKVTFWQNIQTPRTINVDAGYIDATGAVAHSTVNLANVVGVIHDREAAMTCTVNEWQANSPFNASGGYTNMFWHFTERYLNDFTENSVVLLLD
jgi:hypothetical protein